MPNLAKRLHDSIDVPNNTKATEAIQTYPISHIIIPDIKWFARTNFPTLQ